MSEPNPYPNPYDVEPDRPSNPQPSPNPRPNPASGPSPDASPPPTEPPIPIARPASAPATPANQPPRPPPGKAHIDAESLLSGFDEDADLTADPEVEQAMARATGKPPPKKSREAEAVLGDPSRWFVQPGFPSLRVALIAGGVLALAALLAAIARAEQRQAAIAAASLYETLLHTGTGLIAVIAAAWLTQRGFNEPGLALARMLVPVGAFEFISNLTIPIPTRIDEYVLAGAAYFALLWGVFRLPRYETAVLAGCHFFLWLLIQVGAQLDQWAHSPAPTG